MDLFNGDMSVPNMYGSLMNRSIINHPMVSELNLIFETNNLEALFNSNSFFNNQLTSLFNFEDVSSYIESSSSTKNNIDSLIDVFPQLDELVGEMDL